VFVTHLDGSHSSVMGLPLAETAALLADAGIPCWQRAAGASSAATTSVRPLASARQGS
jgi:hypothetical protein